MPYCEEGKDERGLITDGEKEKVCLPEEKGFGKFGE